MLIRASIVLLLALNLGVALWWMTRAPAPAPVAPALAAGVARLQLVDEPVIGPVPASDRSRVVSAPPARIGQCMSLGPFDTASVAASARARLLSQVVRIETRREYAGKPTGWRVLMPPAANAEEAEAAAQRIADAGFSDYFVMREGDDTNAVALGLYGGQGTARARRDAFVAAGFAAIIEPTGAGPASYWLDIGVPAEFDAARAQVAVSAAQREMLDCNEWVGVSAAVP